MPYMYSRWSCRKYAAERATEGVPSEVMEFETLSLIHI